MQTEASLTELKVFPKYKETWALARLEMAGYGCVYVLNVGKKLLMLQPVFSRLILKCIISIVRH